MTLPTDFNYFLLNGQNKTKLNEMISHCAANTLFWNWTGEVVITYGTRVWSRNNGIQEIIQWDDEIHEEVSTIE